MAQMLTDAVIEDVKSRTDLAELIASYGISLRRSGGRYSACCPFHHEKTPSFNIDAAKGFYHCFGCGESGDAITFVMKQEGLQFKEAVVKLASRCGIEIVETADAEAGLRKRLFALMAELAQFYRRCLGTLKEAQIARDYLAKRALGREVQEAFLIGYAPAGAAPMRKWAAKYGFTDVELDAAGVVTLPRGAGDAGYHRFAGRLMFPIRDRQGRTVAFSGRQLVENKNSGKYVNSPETPIFKKSQVLYGFDKAAGAIAKSPHREVICCEGQIDTIRLHTCGFTTAVASQGTAFTEEHARMIKRVADAAVLMYDDDAAGHKATVKTASMLLGMEMPVRVASLPDGDDPDSFLRTKGPEALRKIIDGAQSITAFQCRMEAAKEKNPGSIDAVSRITKAVVRTIAHCPSAVLRASMCAEAARLLSLPAAALGEETDKAVKEVEREKAAERKREAAVAVGAVGAGAPPAEAAPVSPAHEPAAAISGSGEDAGKAASPPAREAALAALLLANQGDAALAATVRDTLPPEIFASDFVRGLAGAWLEDAQGADGGTAAMDGFSAGLPPLQKAWFDKAYVDSSRSAECTVPADEMLRGIVRGLWCDRLRFERGMLPANGTPEADAKRLRISLDLKRLGQADTAAAMRTAEALAAATRGNTD